MKLRTTLLTLALLVALGLIGSAQGIEDTPANPGTLAPTVQQLSTTDTYAALITDICEDDDIDIIGPSPTEDTDAIASVGAGEAVTVTVGDDQVAVEYSETAANDSQTPVGGGHQLPIGEPTPCCVCGTYDGGALCQAWTEPCCCRAFYDLDTGATNCKCEGGVERC